MKMKESSSPTSVKSFDEPPGSTTMKKKTLLVDENLPSNITADPRGNGKEQQQQRLTQKANRRGHGRNTDSFDPSSTLVRPDMRVRVGGLTPSSKPLKHDDIVIIPGLFGEEDDWSLYYKLVQEITDLQQDQQQQQLKQQLKQHQSEKNKSSTRSRGGGGGLDWVSWHEGAHLIVRKPDASPTFQSILDHLCEYFNVDRSTAGYRFNWYKDSSDWKPLHHDSAAFNAQRAQTQNITIGASFGACRELAFLHAAESSCGNESARNDSQRTRIYFPQANNSAMSFGRDVNIKWKHGINALHPQEQDGKGRISIILWGNAKNVVEEADSPPLLGSNGKGPHATSHSNKPQHKRHHNSKKNANKKRGDVCDKNSANSSQQTNKLASKNKEKAETS